MRRRASFLLVCSALLVSLAAAAEEFCQDLTQHTEASLAAIDFGPESDSAAIIGSLVAAREYRVGEVRLVRQPIFDPNNPEEDRWLFRAADRVHADTREAVIREAILFAPDHWVTPSELAESERILRQKPYLFDARVLPRRLCGDRLDVDVVTREVWTLLPRLDFTRLGGDNTFGIGATELNILGRGQELSFGYTSDEYRDGIDVSYYDANVADSRVALLLFAADNDDGSRQFMRVGQPFYALDAPFALELSVDRLDQEETQYFRNDEVSEFERNLIAVGLSGGLNLGRTRRGVWRWTGGFQYEDHTFDPVGFSPTPVPFPEDRTLSYPWTGFEFVEDRFETAVNVDRIARTEDLYLGRRYFGELGYSSSGLGGDDQRRAVYHLGFENARRPHEGRLLQFRADLRGFWNFDRDEEEDVVVFGQAAYRHQQSETFSFAALARGTYTRNLFADRQLLLGGDTGLRGYPSRYQEGDRSFLVSLEERYFSDVYLLRLLRIGYAAFVDVGRAWFPEQTSADDYGALVDVGIGLRLESTRTRRDQIVHVDFGFPLVDGPNTDTMQVSVTIKSSL